MNRTNVALVIIILVTVVTLGLVAYETLKGDPVPAVVQTLLGVVLGFLGTNLASAQGAEQALTSPPAAPVAPPAAPTNAI